MKYSFSNAKAKKKLFMLEKRMHFLRNRRTHLKKALKWLIYTTICTQTPVNLRICGQTST